MCSTHLKLGRVPASSPLPSRLCLLCRFSQKLHSTSRFAHDHSHCPVLVPATLVALPSTRAIETRSLPTLARCFPGSFTFYVTHPIRSIPSLATCSMSLMPSAPFFFLMLPISWKWEMGSYLNSEILRKHGRLTFDCHCARALYEGDGQTEKKVRR
jgi:hypothetical protein